MPATGIPNPLNLITAPFNAVVGALGGGTPPPSAIYTNNPSNLTSLNRKYNPSGQFGQFLPQLPAEVAASLADYDRGRVSRGLSPLTSKQTTLALQSALSNQAATPPKDKSFGQNFISDLMSIGTTIPKLLIPGPGNPLVKEGQEIARLPQLIPQALAHPGLQSIGSLAKLPGFRMIPGSYTVGNLLSGTDPQTGIQSHPSEALHHALYTGLDILPLAQGAAARTPLARAAEVAYQAQRELLAGSGDVASEAAASALHQPKPIQTLLTRTLDPAGNVVPNRLGTIAQDITRATKNTKVGSVVYDTFSAEARDLSRRRSRYDTKVQEINDTASVVGVGDPLYDSAKAADAFYRRTGAMEKFAPIDAPTSIALTQLAMHGDNAAIAALPDLHQAYVREMRDLVTTNEEFGAKVRVTMPDDRSWVYDVPSAEKILGARQTVTRLQGMVDVREAITNPSAATITHTSLPGTLFREGFTPAENVRLLEGQLHALAAQGYDTSSVVPMVKAVKRAKYPPALVDSLAATIDRYAQAPSYRTPIDLEALHTTLAPVARRDPQVAKFLEAIKSSRYQDAITLGRDTLGKRTRYNVIDNLPDILDELATRRSAQKFLDRTSAYSPRALTRAQAKVAKVESRTPPAAMDPILQTEVSTRVQDRLRSRGLELSADPDVVDAWLTLAREHNYGQLRDIIPEAEYRVIQRQVRDNWQGMIEAGVEPPLFVHRVSPGRESQIDYPRISDRPVSPSQERARTADATPYMQDGSVAIKHAALEYVNKRNVEEYVLEHAKAYGRPAAELDIEYRQHAINKVGMDDPTLVRPVMEQLIKREWVKLDPTSYITWPSNRLTQFPEDVMVPRSVKRNMDRMFRDDRLGITGVFDPVMRAFRTSILPLAPRWHLNNIVGGAIVTAIQTSPYALIKYFREGLEMTRTGRAEHRSFLPDGAPPSGMVSMPREEAYRWTGSSPGTTRAKITNAAEYLAGKKLRTFIESMPQGHGYFGKAIQKSFAINGMFDDMYRAITYLYGKDKAERLGLSEASAKAAGVSLVRKTMQSWDEMTPLERTVMKSVFPFYGWMSHIMRMIYQYPYDHPIRTSVTAQFARNELADAGTALPARFQQMFFMGGSDAHGNRTALNLSGMNPFSDIGKYFTLAGFLGNTNPLIEATLKSIGYNPGLGGMELYPELNVDPQTGQLVASPRGNLITNFITSTIPQSQLLLNLAGRNSQWKSLLANNPESASRMLQSQLGFPILARTVNPTQEIIKAEMQRERVSHDAYNQALRTGDWSEALKYPGLRAYLTQIQTLDNAGKLGQYRPQASTVPG